MCARFLFDIRRRYAARHRRLSCWLLIFSKSVLVQIVSILRHPKGPSEGTMQAMCHNCCFLVNQPVLDA
jgi:hypothetical protein